jgi:putative membrane protein
VQRGTTIALIIGVAAATAAVVYAGAGAVARALESLRVTGLVLLVVLHVPIVVLMGFAWWTVSGEDPPASSSRFVYARFVREAAAEVLPFLQLGGVVFGLRALGRGRVIAVGAVSAAIDGIIELTAKLPYTLAALVTLLALAPQLRLTRLLSVALVVSGVVVAILLLARRSLSASLDAIVRAISARWPTILKDHLDGCDLRACFDRLLSHRRRLWSGFALHLCCWFLGAAEVWVVFRLLGVDLSWLQALAIDGTVVGLRAFGFLIPGAAGVQEASYMLVAAVFGISPAIALAASFARRARDLVLGIGTLGIAAAGDPSFAAGRI